MKSNASRTRWAVLGVGLVMAGVAVAWLIDGAGPGDVAVSPGTVVAAARSGSGQGAGNPLPDAAPAAERGLDPVHLELTRLFEIGFAGGLILDGNTRSTLETVLGTLPSDPTAADFAALEAAVRDQLPREDAEKALGLVKSYRGYLQDVQREQAGAPIPSTPAQVQALLAQGEQIQLRHFDAATSQALFEDRRARDQVALMALMIEANPALSTEQKNERYAQLRQDTPEAWRHLVPKAAQATGPAPATPASPPAS